MTIRIAPDKDQPSVAIEVPLQKEIPEYGLNQIEQPTPRDIDALLLSKGFRDLVDDSRGVLMELLANPSNLGRNSDSSNLHLANLPDFEITQLTGAICPGDDVYRPGLWIVLRDRKSPPRQGLQESKLECARAIAREFVKRLALE